MYYIYRITNKINGKTYIGKHEYKKLNDSYMGSGVILKKAQKKYGMENFEKEILVFNISKLEHVNLLEKTFIAAEREKVGRENCYNITYGGDGGNGSKGKHLSEEHKRKIGEANKGKRHSEEQNRKHSELMKGREPWNKGKSGYLSEESKKKIGEAKKGTHHSEEWKKRMSETISGKHWKLVDGKRVYY